MNNKNTQRIDFHVDLSNNFTPPTPAELNVIIDNTLKRCQDEGIVFNNKNEEEVLNILAVSFVMSTELLKKGVMRYV